MCPHAGADPTRGGAYLERCEFLEGGGFPNLQKFLLVFERPGMKKGERKRVCKQQLLAKFSA